MGGSDVGDSGVADTGVGNRGVGARLRGFGAFWYDFVIGDDWLLAAGVVIGLAGTYLLSHAGVAAWWLLPVLVAALLPASLWKATRRRG
jgi:hypothetical protein